MEDRAFAPSGITAVIIHDLRKWTTLRTIEIERERERRGEGKRKRERIRERDGHGGEAACSNEGRH